MAENPILFGTLTPSSFLHLPPTLALRHGDIINRTANGQEIICILLLHGSKRQVLFL